MLLPNFHLSPLDALMSIAGLGRIKTAYAHTIATAYRFFSHGDVCLIERTRIPARPLLDCAVCALCGSSRKAHNAKEHMRAVTRSRFQEAPHDERDD